MPFPAFPVLLVLALLAGCAGGGLAPSAPAQVEAGPAAFRLKILHLNDHHSHLDPVRLPLRPPSAAGGDAPLTVSLGGFARVHRAIEELAAGHRNVLKLHAGDAITGTPYFTQSAGAADAALMRLVCFDAMTLGNHEFDGGDSGLARFLGDLSADPACRTAVLSANLVPGPGSPLAGARIEPLTVVVRDGQEIGIVGVTVREKTERAARPDPGTRLRDEEASAQAAIDALRARGVNKIVLLSHIGYARDRALAARLSGVDVVVGGDSHTLLGDPGLAAYGLMPAGPYPDEARNRDGERVCIVQAWQYAYALGELDVAFDAAGRVRSCAGRAHLLIGDERETRPPAEQAAWNAALAALPALRPTAESPAAEALLAPYRAARVAFGQQVVGRVAEPLCLRRVPGTAREAARSRLPACADDPHVNAHGGDVPQLVAEAFRHQGDRHGGARIALQNGGGVRTDLPAGPLTVDAIHTALPFSNTLVRLWLHGAEVRAVIEDALDAVVRGHSGAYPYAAGLRWRVDLRRPRGERAADLEVREGAGGWVPLDPQTVYPVITSDYLAEGRDGYRTLGTIPAERREPTFLAYADAFLQYVRDHPVLARLPRDAYSTQAFVAPEP